jgi:hypothetical protein
LDFDRAVIRPAGASEIIVEPIPAADGGPVPEFRGNPLPDFAVHISDLIEGGILRVPAL